MLSQVKSNRTVASYEDKRDGRFARIDAQNLTEDTPVQAWIKGLDFPVLLIRQVFTNKDESTGEMFQWLVVILLVMANHRNDLSKTMESGDVLKQLKSKPIFQVPNKLAFAVQKQIC